ncbi:MAG: long-chain fatty acid--CoA ligase [Candidatus Omnitrophica bacterium]|nr:long-chain fatty acid--CoA ligase [Candidatus Omnitrophota bacterium]
MAQRHNTIPQMVFAQARRYGDRAVLKVKRGPAYEEISWNELVSQVEGIALGLMELGVKPGDRVAILSENRPEWAAADLAILSLQGVTVPIYTTLTSAEIEYILRDSQTQVLFVSHPELMAKVVPFQEALDLKVVLFDAPYRVSGPRVWWLGELLGLGKTAGDFLREGWLKRLEAGKGEDLASIIYTSGTTGPPKGVMLTHRNFLSNCEGIQEMLPINEKDMTLSFLPLSHVFERTAGYYFVLLVGGRIAYAQSMEAVPSNLMEARPTIVTGVPRFYEKFRERIEETVRGAPAPKRRIFHWSVQVGRRWAQRRLAGSPIPPGLALKRWLADQLAFSKIRCRLGGRIRFCVSGGAPLSKDLAEFFYAIGVLIVEGYGLTETSPVITVNRPDRFRFGSVGIPLPGLEVRIAEDGEILTRGPHVMQGYFHQPKGTAEVIDSEGWFHTGDIGELSADQFLTITDRKKDLIKTSGGKMVAPQNLENALRGDSLIADCVVIGDRRRYLTALIVPELAGLEAFARKRGISYALPEDLVKERQVLDLIWERVQAVNQHLAPFEQIKKIALLAEPFTMSAGELTPTLKVKRRVVAERYAAQIEAMYKEP